jgi:hypothetical protein
VDRQYSFVETGSSHPLPPSTDDWYENGERAHKINGRTTALAEDRALVPHDWMVGYGVEPTLERPSDDTCEQLLVAGLRLSRLGAERAIARHGLNFYPTANKADRL